MTTRQRHGWIVRYSVRSPKGKMMTVYWSGPEMSWGQHFGPLLDAKSGTLSIAIAVFPTRRDAREAISSSGLRGCVPTALEDAINADPWEMAA